MIAPMTPNNREHCFMRNIFAITLIATLLSVAVSCSREVPISQQEKSRAITFNADISRATVSSAEDIEDFRVYAVMSNAPDQNYTSPNDVVYNHILAGESGEGTLVYRLNDNGTLGDFTYDDTQYWINNRTFHFFAFWPASIEANIAPDGYSYQLEYVAPQEANDDLLTFHYSTYVDLNQTSYPTVPIAFKRILSQIRFELSQNMVTNNYDKFHVTSVSLSGVKAGGVHTTSRYDNDGSWYFYNNKLNFSTTYDEGEPLGHDKTLVVFDELNLVPQPIAQNEMALVVNYTYQQGDSDNNYGEVVEKSISTYLPIGEWKPGRKYVYKMVLSQENIIVFKNIAVYNWGEQPDAGTIIIK